jgi:hypothetical protein
MGLFMGNVVPADGDALATYTAVEATFPGYARVDLANWLAAADDGAGRARTLADLITFTRGAGGAPQNIYGYFVFDATPTLLWAERHPSAPVIMAILGDMFRVNPAFTLRSEA